MAKNVEPLIDALRRIDRERRDAEESQWEALAMEALPAPQLEALRKGSPEDFEAGRPFDAEFRARTIEGVLEAAERLRARAAGDADNVVPLPSTRARPDRRAKLKATPLWISLAAAASLCFFLVERPRPELGAWGQIAHSGGELKQRVALEIRNSVRMRERGSSDLRDSPKADYDVRLTAEKLTLLIKPTEGVDYQPKFRCELESMEKSEFLRWEPLSEPKILSKGTIRIEGTKTQMFPRVPAGTWQLWCAVGPDELPLERLSTLPPGAGKARYAILIFDKLLILGDPPKQIDPGG